MDNQTWNRRYRDYMEKIKTGSLYEVAEVYRDLSLLKHTKDLSFGERKLYDTAQNLLVKELSTAKNKNEKAVTDEIEALFKPDEGLSFSSMSNPPSSFTFRRGPRAGRNSSGLPCWPPKLTTAHAHLPPR